MLKLKQGYISWMNGFFLKNVIIDTLLILHKDILMQKNDHSDV